MRLIQSLLIIVSSVFILSSCKTDVHRDYYSNGTLKEEFSMRNGKWVGKFKAFYEDGKASAIGQFKKGQMTGIWQYYYPDGTIQSIQKFKEGKAISLNLWDTNGKQVIKEGTGVAKHYDQTGQIVSIMSYKDNVFHGKCETWFPNGIKSTEIYYENGKPIGIWKFWNEKGELIKTEKY